MTVRRINGAAGDLYDHDSDAHHLGLKQLESFLRDIIGFQVVKKIAREKTLRVYPTKITRYPVLNPRFFPPHFVFFDGSLETDCECLHFAACSQGDESKRGTMPCVRRTLDRYLRTFETTREFAFFPTGRAAGKDYYQHGRFILPLRFKAKEIDFGAVNTPLRTLLNFLENLPART